MFTVWVYLWSIFLVKKYLQTVSDRIILELCHDNNIRSFQRKVDVHTAGSVDDYLRCPET